MHETELKPEIAVLCGVDLGTENTENSIEELGELAKTAGAEVAAIVTQKRDSPDSRTFLGKGRIEEIREFLENNEEVNLVIFDDELTPAQQKNIEEALGVKVIDRTLLILDIFARRAFSAEGKLQVELAQLKYRLTRLTGKGIALSRLGGGIGTRGPGETKLESDRRHIRLRISNLERELKEIAKRRELQRRQRAKSGIATVSVVGYTNAGKSTLLNYLTDADVLSENKLFATLDPTTRLLKLPAGREILLTDTVGFIRKLPHHLIEAFKSTLEEAVLADLLLVLTDISEEESAARLEVSLKILSDLGADSGKIITVGNKIDLCGEVSPDLPGNARYISAATGQGIAGLLMEIENRLEADRRQVTMLLPFEKSGTAAQIRSEGRVISEEYTDEGILINAVVPDSLIKQNKQYIII